LSKERIEMCEVSQKRVETCETCPKRELKCVRVLERDIDSVHVTRNASKKMRPHLKKELPMKNSKNLTSSEKKFGEFGGEMCFSSANFTNFANVLKFFAPKMLISQNKKLKN
jgi:hypothetical protein